MVYVAVRMMSGWYVHTCVDLIDVKTSKMWQNIEHSVECGEFVMLFDDLDEFREYVAASREEVRMVGEDEDAG